MKTKIKNKFFAIFIAVTFLLVLLVWVPKFLGFSLYYVSSDSMEPTIYKGSLSFAERIEFSDIAVGEDVLVFANDAHSKTFMHRVIAINEKAEIIYTKGDNNNTADPLPTPFSVCEGRVVFSVPLLGYVAWALDTLAGKIAVVIIYIVCAAVLIEKRRVLKSKKEVVENEK